MTMPIYPDVSLRPITPADMDFLCQVYTSSREQEYNLPVWKPGEREVFFRMQFEAQHAHYHEHYPDARFDLIQLKGKPIGRIYTCRFKDEYRLMEVTLLPAYRNRGIGTAFLEDLQSRAASENVAVRLHVEPFNPAKRLYDRHGFKFVKEVGVYHFMEWTPQEKDQ